MSSENRLIYANALEEAITVDYFEHFTQCHDTDQIALIDMVRECIGNAPTVDAVEVVHGHWKFNRGAAPNEKLYFCSVCIGGESDYGSDNYCPNCGAKMDGEDSGVR